MQKNLILKGSWTKADWSFYISGETPQDLPITAVFGLAHVDDNIILVNTKRGWELPGGHVENGEAHLDALKRELLEEAGIGAVTSTKLFGHMKIKNTIDKLNKATGEIYPTRSCILYFLVDFQGELTAQSGDDCFGRVVVPAIDEKVVTSHMSSQILVGESIFLFNRR